MPDSSRQLPPAEALQTKRYDFAAELRDGFHHHGLLLAAAAAVMVFGNIVSGMTGYSVPVPLLAFIKRYVLFAGIVVLCAAALWTFLSYLLVERRPSPHRAFVHWLLREALSPARLLNGTLGMAAVLMLVMGFLQAKNNVLRLPQHGFDAQWSALDRLLHFGVLPQDLLRPLLGVPGLTRFLDIAYVGWQPVMLAAFFAGAFQKRRSLERHRFLLALIMIYGLGGSVLAVALSSGGPAFFGLLASQPDPYAPHMAFLNAVNDNMPLDAVLTQQMIWSSREIGRGVSLISAMPSMHVAVAALLVFGVWRFGWQARAASLAFFAVIFLGSIHLGWHYAVDGYAAVLISWAAWTLALPVSRWYLPERRGDR